MVHVITCSKVWVVVMEVVVVVAREAALARERDLHVKALSNILSCVISECLFDNNLYRVGQKKWTIFEST